MIPLLVLLLVVVTTLIVPTGVACASRPRRITVTRRNASQNERPPLHPHGAVLPRVVRWYVPAEGVYELPETHVARGQPVVFRWVGAHHHTVHRLGDKDAYEHCDFGRSVEQLPRHRRSEEEAIWGGSSEPGVFYFACRVRKHCAQGMRVTLHVD